MKTGASPVGIVTRPSAAGGADVDVVEDRSTGIVAVPRAVGGSVVAAVAGSDDPAAGGLVVGTTCWAVLVVVGCGPLVLDVVADGAGCGTRDDPVWSPTSTTPVMPEWRVHRYGKRPGCRNVLL
ncbi:MAG: hypothetical protein M3357_10245 [Actinomycetota bacterium]|nr:hypothetical protein [Actinomycetota bacterium]